MGKIPTPERRAFIVLPHQGRFHHARKFRLATLGKQCEQQFCNRERHSTPAQIVIPPLAEGISTEPPARKCDWQSSLGSRSAAEPGRFGVAGPAQLRLFPRGNHLSP